MIRSEANRPKQAAWARYALLAAVMALAATSAGATSTLQWSWANPFPGPDYFKQIAFDGSTYVVAGTDGALYSSSDGVSWTQEADLIGRNGPAASLIYGGGHFVLAGSDGEKNNHLFSSTDGIHWTAASITGWTSDDRDMSLAYDNITYFLIDHDVSSPGIYFTSTDSVHWTKHTQDFTISQMIAANGVLVSYVFEPSGAEMLEYSKDEGATWQEVTSFTNGVNPNLYTDGSTLFLANYEDKASVTGIYSSSDGAHWTRRTGTLGGLFHAISLPIFWDGSKFLTIAPTGSSTEDLYTSSDGISWSPGSPSTLDILPSAVVTGSGYIAAGPGILQIIKSSDFTNWSTVFSSGSSLGIDFEDMVHANGQYIAVGQASQRSTGIAQSSDGLHWNDVYTGTAVTVNNYVAYGNGMYLATGGGSWVSSSDGVHWNAVARPPGTAWSQVVFGNGVFAALVGCAPTCEAATSPDGQTWTTRALPSGAQGDISTNESLGYLGNRFITLGSGGVVYTSADGLNWKKGSSISALEGYEFTRMREVAGSLVAMGDCPGEDPCASDDTFIVAVTRDGVKWSVADGSADGITDVTGDGHGYYATALLTAVLESQDGLHWCPVTGTPSAFGSGDVMAMDGTQIAVASFGAGDIIATPQPSSGVENPAITCETEAEFQASAPPPPPPPVSKGSGGGGFDMLSMCALLGFGLRRRGGARRAT